MGIPLAMQNAMMSLYEMAIQFVVNGYGTQIMAAYTASVRVFGIARIPFGVLGVACANFSGQNIGAGHFERVKECIRKASALVIGYGACSMAVLYLFGQQIISIFVAEPEVIRVGAAGLRITAVFFIVNGLTNIYRAVLNGAGDAAFTMFNGLLEVAGSIILIFGLTSIPAIGMWGIWATGGISAVLACIVCFGRLRGKKWRVDIAAESKRR